MHKSQKGLTRVSKSSRVVDLLPDLHNDDHPINPQLISMQKRKCASIGGCLGERCRPSQMGVIILTVIGCIELPSSSRANNVPAIHKHLCLEDDYTNDLPIFIERQTICNFDSAPVHIYTIKTMPDSIENKYCLKGENAEKFRITDDKEIKLYDRLMQPETNLRLQIIRTSNDIVGTPTERRQAINAIQFNLNLEECNQVSWQTIVVAILSSACVALMSSLAIMLILYQQKGLIKTTNDDEKADERVRYATTNNRDESFINPRRTSSYEFSTMSRNSASTLERQETENL